MYASFVMNKVVVSVTYQVYFESMVTIFAENVCEAGPTINITLLINFTQ